MSAASQSAFVNGSLPMSNLAGVAAMTPMTTALAPGSTG